MYLCSWRRASHGFGEAKGEWAAHSNSSLPYFYGSKSISRLLSMVRIDVEGWMVLVIELDED